MGIMNKLLTLGVVVVVVTAGFVGVRLVDPFYSPFADQDRELDLSESPAEIAATAAAKRVTTSYTARVTFNDTNTSRAPNDTREFARIQGTRIYRYDADDLQARARGPGGIKVFANTHYAWVQRPDESTTDRVAGELRTNYSAPEAIRNCNCVAVEADNETTLVLSITDNATAMQVIGFRPRSNRNASVRLVIDKDGPLLRKLVFRIVRQEDADTRLISVTTVVYSDWSDTDVHRPDWADYSTQELLRDLLNRDRTGPSYDPMYR